MKFLKWLFADSPKIEAKPLVNTEITFLTKEDRYNDALKKLEKEGNDFLELETDKYKIVITTKNAEKFESSEYSARVDILNHYGYHGDTIPYLNKLTAKQVAESDIYTYQHNIFFPIGDCHIKTEVIDNIRLVKLEKTLK